MTDYQSMLLFLGVAVIGGLTADVVIAWLKRPRP